MTSSPTNIIWRREFCLSHVTPLLSVSAFPGRVPVFSNILHLVNNTSWCMFMGFNET